MASNHNALQAADMKVQRIHWLHVVILPLALMLSACGGDDEQKPGGGMTAIRTIGAAGGTVNGPNGAQVLIPAGALTQAAPIAIEQSSAGAPALPSGVLAVGPMYAFTPHGTTFASPATVTVPFDQAQAPSGARLVLLKTNAAQTGWEEVANATVNAAFMSGAVSSFSWILVSRLPPPVESTEAPQRFYEFGGFDIEGRYRAISGNFDQIPSAVGAPAGELLATERFGNLPFIPPGRDEFADGEVFSTEDGKTYWTEAEAPSGDLLARDPDKTFLGGRSVLRLDQSYRKNSSNATMELVITQAAMLVADLNAPGPRLAGCPWSGAPENTLEDCNDLLSAGLSMHVWVFEGSALDRDPGRGYELYHSIRGSARLTQGRGADTIFEVFRNDLERITPGEAQHPRHKSLWSASLFEKVASGSYTEMHLREPLRVPVDLSRVPECVDPNNPALCPEFTLETAITSVTHNRRAGETYAISRLRDPVNIDGVAVITTGLTPTNRPLIGDVTFKQPAPPACADGDDADAGVLEFSAPAYRIMEFGALEPQIVVVRLGGSAGEISAKVVSRDGSAEQGVHYSAVAQTLIFEDGDATPRVIELPLLDNTDHDGNVALELVLEADPGCAALGDPSSAQVVIIDDEALGAPPGPSGALDATFGVGGKVDTAPFGGAQSKMALQPDGKIVMVGGAFTDFVLARFTPDGSLDASFGSGGQVTTDIAGGVQTERARAAAIQSDGKIVVVGEGTMASGEVGVALARYNSDGSLDASFSGDGMTLGDVRGRAFAIAVQSDGRILIAGDTLISGNPNDAADLLIARFEPDGRLDASFGVGGQRVLNVAGRADLARNLAVLPDGDIIVAGDPFGSEPTDRTAVVRLDASGALDAAFGANGVVILNHRMGRGLTVQPDGKLLLVGPSSVAGVSEFAMTRLNADGAVDTTFGVNGVVTTSLSNSTSGAGDAAQAVALHPDGRIYVAGVSGSINRNFGLARYSSSGALDATFASGGVASHDFNGLTDSAESVAVLADGRIVLGGVTTPASSDGYGLVRVHP